MEAATITEPLQRRFHKTQRWEVSRLKAIMHKATKHKPIFLEEMFGKLTSMCIT